MIQKYETNLRKNISKGNYALEFSDKNIDDEKFHENKRGAYVSEVFVIFKDDFEDYENQMTENISKIQSLEAELEEKNQTIKKLKDKLSAIDKDHQKEMKNLKQDHSAKVEALNETIHEKDLENERVKTEYERQIGNLKESNQKEINHLQLFDKDKHMKIQDHNDEVSSMKDNHQKEIEGLKDKIVRETIINKDHLNELEKGLTISGFIRGKYKTPLNDLKEGIEHFQYISQYSETIENQALNVNKKEKEDK